MDLKKLRVFVKLYWIRILLFTILTLLAISFVWIVTAGIQSFLSMESFYRKSVLAQMAFGLYTGIFHALIFASIYMGFHYYFFFGGGISKLGKKKAKPEEVNVKWSDVVGLESVKKEVWEVIRLIKDRANLKIAGGRIIRGVLMVGPPGCGKTYLAKAIATETKLPFLHATGSEFRGIFVGVGTSRIKSIFKEARALAELHGGCIIFIDEIDTVARPRVTPMGFGGGSDYNATVNQLLTELDGLGTSKDNIVVIGATNVAESELDEALMRAGRFDRKIYVGMPSLKEREQIIAYYLNKVDYDKENINTEKLARITVSNSAADIANIIREASLIALRKRKTKINMADLHEAQERIALGIKSDVSLSKKDKLIAAYHEAGHAMVCYLLVPTQDVFKASIIPRKGLGGATWIMESEERFIPDKEDLLGKIKISLGGYAAEKIKFGMNSTGVGDDLIKANQLAEKMVSMWGMGTSGAVAKGSVYSHLWQRDTEDIINTCLNEVNEMLRKEKDIFEEISQKLLEKEELDYDELDAIFKKHGKALDPQKSLEYTTEKKKEGVTWEDVVGMEETKEEAKEMVSLIKDRVKLKQVGGQIIRGLILFGPPGCGKTYLASAIANEAGIPFISKSGSEFVEMYVGVGASRIRHLFQEAREQALTKGGCIIFIDELDALGMKRSPHSSGGASEYSHALNQLLVELDGLKEKDLQYNIVVVGATNMDESFMDAALLRPGRFDRKIYVDLPTFEERKKLFQYYLGKVKYDPAEIDIDKFAGITQGRSPADIANLIRESALLAVRNKKECVGLKEIDEARERIELGLRRRYKQNEEELRTTAYHEAGHCIINYLTNKKSLPFKLSIIPRKRSLGVAWYTTPGDIHSGTKETLLANIKTALAGYVAEKLKFNTSSTGVASDFATAMKTAHTMVWELGMGSSGLIGSFQSLYARDNQSQPLLSEEMKAKLDNETQRILQESLKETENFLKDKQALLDALAEELLKKEELNHSELEDLFNKYGQISPKDSPNS